MNVLLGKQQKPWDSRHICISTSEGNHIKILITALVPALELMFFPALALV